MSPLFRPFVSLLVTRAPCVQRTDVVKMLQGHGRTLSTACRPSCQHSVSPLSACWFAHCQHAGALIILQTF